MVSDDIVTRLRGCWCGDGFANRGIVDPACDHDGVRADAADEIERLRADVKRWRNWAEEYFYTDPDCECPLCDQVKAAINGDR